MSEVYAIKNGKRFLIDIITNFKFNDCMYSVYTLDEKKDNCDIYCGKVIDGVLTKITNSTERRAVDNIVNNLFSSIRLDDDSDGEYVHINYDGEEVLAEVLDIMNINDEEYVILSVENNDMSDIFAMKVVHIGDNVQYIRLSNDEQELVLSTIEDILE